MSPRTLIQQLTLLGDINPDTRIFFANYAKICHLGLIQLIERISYHARGFAVIHKHCTELDSCTMNKTAKKMSILITAGLDSLCGRTQKKCRETREDYDKSETTYEKLSLRRIHWCGEIFIFSFILKKDRKCPTAGLLIS